MALPKAMAAMAMAKHDENGDDATAKGKRPKGNRFGEPSFLALCGVN